MEPAPGSSAAFARAAAIAARSGAGGQPMFPPPQKALGSGPSSGSTPSSRGEQGAPAAFGLAPSSRGSTPASKDHPHHLVWGDSASSDSAKGGQPAGQGQKVGTISAIAGSILDDLGNGAPISEPPSSGSIGQVYQIMQRTHEEAAPRQPPLLAEPPDNSLEHRVWSSSTSNVEEGDLKHLPEEVKASYTLSTGSAEHGSGKCKPCLFVHTRGGCEAGSKCSFCHYRHKRKERPRPCKAKRDRYRKLFNAVQPPGSQQERGSDEEGADTATGRGSDEEGTATGRGSDGEASAAGGGGGGEEDKTAKPQLKLAVGQGSTTQGRRSPAPSVISSIVEL